jgi:hypothetical protein
MKLEKLCIDKQANVILGAGASRGASCFETMWAQSPLDADFFDQVDRLKGLPACNELHDIAEFARDEFGASDGLLMEPFFTQLESLNEFYSELKIDRGPRVRAYEKRLEKFPTYLAALFRGLCSIAQKNDLACHYHDALCRSLRTNDAIISFNYDCIVDAALKKSSGKSWDASSGYGVGVENGADEWHDHSGRGAAAKHPIKLLKVHGSLNWIRDPGKDTISLRKDPYEKKNRTANEVVPPIWNKRVSSDAVLGKIWKGARTALQTGPVLVVIGYSVPDTDLLSQVLLRVATSESGKTLSHLISVNLDVRAHRKIRNVLAQALTSKSTIIELGSWKEFCALL